MFAGVASWVSGWARLRPDHPAVIFDEQPITWAEYDEQIDRWATALRDAGVERGDRVGLYMRNRPEFLYGFFATARIGAIVVPVNHFLSSREVSSTLRHSGAIVVVTDGEFDAVIAEVSPELEVRQWLSAADPPPAITAPQRPAPIAEPIGLDDPAVILYTSGTTGMPKGAITTHGGILFCTLQWVIQVRHAPGDVHICHFPLAFTGGTMAATMPVVHSGGTMILDHGFDPGRTLDYIERYGIAFVAGVPTMWKAMLDHPRFGATDLSSIRLGFIGAAPVPLPLIEAFRARDVPFAQAYALTEGNGLCLFLPTEDIARKLGSCGLDLLYCEGKVVDDAGAECPPGEVGELVLRGPVVFPGYWNDPEETARTLVDGWLHTGDLATRDAEGYFSIVDRKKDLIITGGLNVYPAEVESVLYGIAGVREAAVVGAPHDHWGEEVVAVLAGDAGLAEETVLAEARRGLAAYKVPKRVIFVDELPKTLSGKIQRRRVLADLVPVAG
ncbi:MAG: class I adenylate-forming enzyme family protein [Ilumatobacteraceae bacterium]